MRQLDRHEAGDLPILCMGIVEAYCASVQADLKGKGLGALTKGGAMLRLPPPLLRLPIRIYYDITLLIRQWKFTR